jgi:DNA-binding GntR family transcriptional regulator
MNSEKEILNPTQLRHAIANRLRTSILSDEIKPGEWLRQELLAQKFGVSHTPVREALQDLAGEGLVEHVPYRGIRVVEFTLADLLDLYTVRAVAEGLAARYAAQNVTPAELQELEYAFQQLKDTPINVNVDEHRKLHRQFHQLIHSFSRHAYLIRSLNQMWNTFPTLMLSSFEQTANRPIGRGDAATAEHRAIVDAIQAHDGAAAERLMQQHIQATAQSIATVVEHNRRREAE